MKVVVKDHLTEKCRERNISLAELARRTGLHKAGIYHKNNFTLTSIAKILIVLDCKFEDVFEIIEL